MNRHNIFQDIYDKMNTDDDLPPQFPYLIDMEITNACNLRCEFCSRQLMNRYVGYMDRETFHKVIDECAKYGTGIRFIRWGEPFLHPHIIEYAAYIKAKGLPLHITNNGLVISEVQMRAIIDLQVDSIIFSMQGLTKEEYEKQRGAIYDLFESNIKRLVDMRGNAKKPYIHITCTADDLTDSDKFINEWKKSVDKVTVGRTNWSRILHEIKGEYINCKEPWQKLSVDWNGKVTACCGDYDNLLTIGNINQDRLYSLWNYNEILYGIRCLLREGMNRSLTLCNKCYPAHGNFSNNTS